MTSNEKKVVQKVVLGGVVINNGRILILQRHDNESVYPGMWELPSGKKENLESSETSLLREIKEESGLDVEIIALVSVFDYQIDKPDEIRDSTQINFLVRPIAGSQVLLSEEHQAFNWISEEELEKYPLTEATKKVIKTAFEMNSRV